MRLELPNGFGLIHCILEVILNLGFARPHHKKIITVKHKYIENQAG